MEKHTKLLLIFLVILSIISLATKTYGSTDIGDYAGVAKFFAGEYNAKIRTSHSMLYGFIHSPLVWLFQSLFVMKLTSLLFLILIIMSVYYISGKNKKTLVLLIASPIVWYIAPWINPIQLAGLLFLWGYFFFTKFEKSTEKRYLIYSGILMGLSWAFWNTVIFILFFFTICFFYNQKFKFLIIFFLFIIIGFAPLLILDQILYGFPLFSTFKFFFGTFLYIFYGGIYPAKNLLYHSVGEILTFLLMFPIFIYTLFLKKFFKENKRQVIFLTICFLFFIFNPQIRYLIFFWPIFILYLSRSLTEKQFKIQIIIFLLISLLVIQPYLIQIKYSTNTTEFTSIFLNFGRWEISSINEDKLISEDLKQIAKEYPNESFIVGNTPDDYAYLAFIYWGKEIKEFVSIQDYDLYLKNESVLFEKKLTFTPKIQDRREIWISGGMSKSENDSTNYENISLGIGCGEQINLENFKLIKKYNVLYLSKKI